MGEGSSYSWAPLSVHCPSMSAPVHHHYHRVAGFGMIKRLINHLFFMDALKLSARFFVGQRDGVWTGQVCSVSWDKNVVTKEDKEIANYCSPAKEIRKMHRVSTKTVPWLVGYLGVVSDHLEGFLKDLEILDVLGGLQDSAVDQPNHPEDGKSPSPFLFIEIQELLLLLLLLYR